MLSSSVPMPWPNCATMRKQSEVPPKKCYLCHVQNRSKSFKCHLTPSNPTKRTSRTDKLENAWPQDASSHGLRVELLKLMQGLMVLGRRFLVPQGLSKEMWLSLFFHGICSKFHLILCRCSITDLLEAALHPTLTSWTSSKIVHRHRHINFLLQIIHILSNVHLNSLGQCEARIWFQWESSDQTEPLATLSSTPKTPSTIDSWVNTVGTFYRRRRTSVTRSGEFIAAASNIKMPHFHVVSCTNCDCLTWLQSHQRFAPNAEFASTCCLSWQLSRQPKQWRGLGYRKVGIFSILQKENAKRCKTHAAISGLSKGFQMHKQAAQGIQNLQVPRRSNQDESRQLRFQCSFWGPAATKWVRLLWDVEESILYSYFLRWLI